jgi:hypothetical protein
MPTQYRCILAVLLSCSSNAQVEPQKGRPVLSVGLELDVSMYLMY